METLSAWAPLILAGEVMLVSVALGVVLLGLLKRCRRQLDEQQEQLEQLSKRQAGVFLEREIAHTRELSQRLEHGDDRMRDLLHARIRWLQAEQRALVEEGAAKSDYALLKRAAQPLLALLGNGEPTLRSRGAAVRADATTGDPLQRARTVIGLQKEIISRLKDQLKPDAPDAAAGQAFSTALGHVDDTVQLQSSLVAKLEAELAAARDSDQCLSEELTRLQARREPSCGATGLLVVNRDKPALSMDSARALIGEMEHAHGESLNELGAMRDTNARQRQLILQLEKELVTMRRESGEHTTSQALLDNLKLQLRDHENCTAMLEVEAANLRIRIGTLLRVIDTAEHSGSVDMVDHVHREAADAAAAHGWSERQRLGQLRLAEIAGFDTVERACPPVASWFGDLGLTYVVYIRGAEQQYWLTSEAGGIDDRIRSLLLSAVPGTGSAWTEVRDGALFVGATLRLHLVERFDGEDPALLRDMLTPQLTVLDALLFHLDSKSRQPRQVLLFKNLLEQAGRQISGIDMQHNYITEESARIGRKLHGEMSRYFATLEMTEVQRECIDGMLDDFKTEINLLVRASKGLRNNLRVAARGLNQLNSEPLA